MEQTLSDNLIISENNTELILFVCMGNTCRSPMCAALFNSKYANVNQVGDSAGFCSSEIPITSFAVSALKKYGVLPSLNNDFPSHKSKQIDETLIKKASGIYCVSSNLAMYLISQYPQYATKISSFKHDIFDPFGFDDETYDYCLSLIDKEMELLFGNKK